MCFRKLEILCVLIFISTCIHHKVTDAACSFPMSSGSWLSTDKGTLTFTSTTIRGYPTSAFGSTTIDLDCDQSSGNLYIARSSSFTHYNAVVRAYMCFIINRVNHYQYYYYLGSNEDSTLNNERMKTVAVTANVTFNNICDRDRTTLPAGLYYILVQEGYTSQLSTTCHSNIRGEWSYTYTEPSGNTQCGSGSALDICTSFSTLTYNYTACSQNIMYSAGGELYCLVSSSSGSMTYQHVYNIDNTTDESTTYRITCLVLSVDGDTRYLTQYPTNCYDVQTSTTVRSPGASLVFTLEESCPSTTTDNNTATAAIALGVIVPLLLIIVGIIIAHRLHKHYQETKEIPTPKPDPKYANGEIRNKRLSKSNGVRIDEKAIIYDTPRSVEINIDEKCIRPESSIIGDDMSLRRESSILIDINPSTRGTMVAESLPEMSENEYSSEYSSDTDSENENGPFQVTGEFLEGKVSEGTQTPNIPQIVIDSVAQEQDMIPDLVAPISTVNADTQSQTPDQQSDGTQTDKTNKTNKKKGKKRRKSAKRVKSASKRRSDSQLKGILKQKPDCYGNTDDRIVFGTRVTVLGIRPKSFRKKKQVEPMRTDDVSPSPINQTLDIRPGSSRLRTTPESPNEVQSNADNCDVDNDDGSQTVIPDETKDVNASKANLKRNESRLREKIYRVTNRDISTSKRRKKQPKLLHPLENKKGGSPEPISESWFKHKGNSASKSRNTFGDDGNGDNDEEVSPEVDEHGNLIQQDEPYGKRPPTQQKSFVNPKAESTEEVFEKIKKMWHFGNKWLGNTYIAHTDNKH